VSLREKIYTLARRVIEYKDPLEEKIPGRSRLLFNENLVLPQEYYNRLLEAVKQKLDDAIRFYPSTRYKRAVAEKLCEVYRLDPSQVILTAGADEGIKLVLELALLYSDTRKMLIVRPCYSMPQVYANNMLFESYSVVIDRKSLTIPIELLEKMYIRERPSIIYLCVPNNPLGISHSLEEVKKVVEIASSSIVLIDETYVDYSDKDLSTLVKDYDNVVIVRSLSKSWGLAGLRIGYIISTEETVKVLNSLAQPFNVSSIALIMLETALEMYDLVKKCVEETKKLRDYLYLELQKVHGIERVFPSYTNFITFSLGSPERAHKVYLKLKDHGFYVRRITEPQYDDCLRVTIASRDVMDNFIYTLRKILEEGV